MNGVPLRRIHAGLGFFFLVFFFFATVAPAAMPPKEGLRHGSRAKAADGTMVVYDNVNGVFLVPGRKDTYWIDEHFYQYENGVWLTADKIAGPWDLSPQHLVPDAALELFEPLQSPVTAKLPWGSEAVYEPRLKVFKMAGKKGVFLFDGRFYRYDTGVWFEAKRDEGPWAPTSMKILPVMLRKAVPPPESGQTVKLPSGETVVYDADKRIFHVENKPDTLLFDGTFYEKREEKWFAAPSAAAGFKEMQAEKVPPPVRLVYRKPADPDKKKNAEGKNKDGKAKGAKKGEGKAGAKKAKNAGEKKNRKAAKAADKKAADSAGDDPDAE